MFRSSNEPTENQALEDSALTAGSQEIPEDDSSEELFPLEQWIQRNPSFRHDEIDYIKRAELGYPCTITENGDLQQPFNAIGWTFLNPADPMSSSSLANGDGFKPVDKAVVATEWYQTNPQLQKLEIKAMADIHPDAKMDYLPNGKMYWTIRIHPVVCGKRKDWTLLAVYDSDHPQQRWGGSVKFYPVKPNYDEMMQMVNRSNVTPKAIPHLLRDEDNQIYMSMSTPYRNNIYAGHNKGEKVATAAAYIRFAIRWITVFEFGLIDQKAWSLFQEPGGI